jgi:hypothetical protein
MKDVLDSAIEQWKSNRKPDRSLTPAVRDQIIRETFEGATLRPVGAPLFSPVPRRLLAGILPVALAILVFGLFPERIADPPSPARPAKLQARKAGDQVVFTITNGGTSHQVYKSSDPNRFARGQRLAVRGGSFRDSASDHADLVFYRID